MGLNISPDVFQQHMVQLFGDLNFVKCYLDDILIFTNGTFEDHMHKVLLVLQRLANKGLQINANKSFWAVKEVDYLGFRLTPEGVRPQPKKGRRHNKHDITAYKEATSYVHWSRQFLPVYVATSESSTGTTYYFNK
jgi:hypothetical protein